MKSQNDLIIIEKYEAFLNYIYPVFQNIPRRHGIVKQKAIDLVFEEQEIFYKALKSKQKSKLYEADAGLASIRFYLRFFSNKNRKLISPKNHQRAEILLAEVGAILNSWITKGK